MTEQEEIRFEKLSRVARLAREYVELEVADDPTIIEEGSALYALRVALESLGT